MAYEISRKSPIGELVLNVPSAASVLLEKGFHCIGCGLAAYETLEEGAAAHGFDDAAIDALVRELKDAAKKDDAALAKAAEKQAAAKAPKTSKKSKKASKPG